jgi:hypothetical protein
LIWRINSVPGQLHRAGLKIKLDSESINGWHHVAVAIDRTENRLKAYLNGETEYDNRYSGAQKLNYSWTPLWPSNEDEALNESETATCSASIETASPLIVGRREDGEYGFSGWVDDVRIYKGYVISNDDAMLLASEDFLRFDDATEKRLSNSNVRDFLSISPVVVPDSSNTPKGNRHFGWPIAAQNEQQIVVAYNRALFHGAENTMEFPFWEKRTNLKLPDNFQSQELRGTFLDTNEIIFNPVTKRFEVLLTDRASNQDEENPSERMSLTLWSISVKALLTGDDSPAVFTKMGELIYPGAAIFQMRRLLDTPTLSSALKSAE